MYINSCLHSENVSSIFGRFTSNKAKNDIIESQITRLKHCRSDSLSLRDLRLRRQTKRKIAPYDEKKKNHHDP